MSTLQTDVTTFLCVYPIAYISLLVVCKYWYIFLRMEPSTNQVKEPVYKKAIDKWRQVIPKDMQRTMYRTAPLLQQLGYKM